MRKVKVLSLFSGIGAFEKALDKLGVEYDLVNYCEIDKYASKAYTMIHECGEDKNLGDITKVDTSELPEDIDIMTYGFPCQDISLNGKQKGFEENGERTRSGLFFEALRIIEDKKPKVAICENVKNLTSKKFKKEFEIVLDSLERNGYMNYWEVLNAKDYGIPQNRERVFVVSIRKDLDKGLFEFPKTLELKLRLKDLLEDKVDEKYYINTEKEKQLIKIIIEKNESSAKENISPVLTTMQGGNRQPMVIVKEATKKGYAEAFWGDSINLEHPNSKTRRGRVGRQIAQTLTTSCNQGVVVREEDGEYYRYRIRKLIPKECWKLMGFSDSDLEKIVGISDTQLYKMAGNSIVVDVLEHIFKEIFRVVEFDARKTKIIELKVEEETQQMAFCF